MARRNRETLKNYFLKGKRPSQQDFADLIDSTLNTLDDGFSSTPQSGLNLTPLSDSGIVFSISKASNENDATWKLAVNKTNGNLLLLNGNNEDAKCLFELKNIWKNLEEKNKQSDLIIDGNITSKSRKGSFRSGSVKADGQWHDILTHNEQYPMGCWAFEIVAGCGSQTQSQCAMAVAITTHCYGKKAKIETIRSHSGRRRNRLKLRWKKEKTDGKFRLQIKTVSDYKPAVSIHYQMTSLWDNPLMANN